MGCPMGMPEFPWDCWLVGTNTLPGRLERPGIGFFLIWRSGVLDLGGDCVTMLPWNWARMAASLILFGPGFCCDTGGRDDMGGACSCWTRLEELEGGGGWTGLVPRPLSRSSTVVRDFLLTVWMPDGLPLLIWTGRRFDVTGPGGRDMTLGVDLAGRACWAMMWGGRPGDWIWRSLDMLVRGLALEPVEGFLRRIERPPPLGEGELKFELTLGIFWETSSFPHLEDGTAVMSSICGRLGVLMNCLTEDLGVIVTSGLGEGSRTW